ncbi:AAA family ATPase [Myceligenerans indicum]|uniref:AAA family ATPase n=1 Tax=Myceligenerans indicum TaxID=2593663 RepID=A0ABS1LI35_9MICO|nr:ATP-binding protein [Myceligenerans indicum]MBL0885242.1 AAA family ATPase [Myceligenerans indicum]
MLTEVTLENFKSYSAAQTLELSSMTVLVGANAAGKSNAIEAIRFLSWLAQGQSLGSIQYQVNSADRVVRGISSKLAHLGGKEFSLGCRLERDSWDRMEVRLEYRSDGFHIVGEHITDKNQKVPLYTLDQPSTDRGTEASVAYNNFARGGKKPHIRASDQHAVFTQLVSGAVIEAGHKVSRATIPGVAKEYEATLARVLFLDPVPARMREYAFPSETRLNGDGSNISAVLYNLCEASAASTETKTQVLDFVRSLPEQEIADIEFLAEPRGGRLLQLVETFGRDYRRYDASLLSDGTLRVLAIAAAMLSADRGSLVVIEEIDNGVHPSRARDLLERIQRIAAARGLRVLLSTHNPALLDALPLEAIPRVVFCYRDPEDGDSRLVTLEELDSYPELVARGPLGRLLSAGDVDRAAKRLGTRPGSPRDLLRARLGIAS